MKIRLAATVALCCLGFVACAQTRPSKQEPLSSSEARVVRSEVEQVIREFFAGFSAATSTDGTPVSKFASDPTLYVLDTEVVMVSLADYEQGIRERASQWQKHAGGVDSITVEATCRGAAVAAWTYHDDILMNSGARRMTHGAVLMSLVKGPDGWLITATKVSETPVP